MSGLFLPQIAVTGYGCVSAAGANSDVAMCSINDGQAHNSLLGPPFFPSSFKSPCFLVKGVSAGGFTCLPDINKDRFSGLNRTIMLALTAIDEALVRAGLSVDELREKRVGIALGTTVGCTFHDEGYYVDWRAGIEPDPAVMETYLSSNLAGCVQNILGVQGPRAVITNACSSGTDAIGLAKSWLEYGLCDIAVAGGADEISRIACHGFKSLMLVSEESCKPFDRDRRGLNLGEGAGILVLEKEVQATSNNRRIVGWIRGYGIAGDAHHPTAPHPRGRGLQLAVAKALEDAGVSVNDISMINGHGTGTQANDKAEANGIYELGFAVPSLPVVSTKGATGHTLGAAGGIEAVFTLLALNQGELSGTIGCLNSDPELPFTVLGQGECAALKGRTGVSQSLAFGGSNGALVIEGAG
jgi:3-oxoacyl-(acyl-carrier-protein) synthase